MYTTCIRCVYNLYSMCDFMSTRLNIYSEAYTEFVINSLVNIKGKSISDVANFIIKEWISDHREELKEYGITVGNAKKEGVLR